MTPQFFGREVKVTLSGEVKVPTSFRLDDREYVISEITEAWHDYGFGRSPLRHRKWWQRHHRTYYRVKTTQGRGLRNLLRPRHQAQPLRAQEVVPLPPALAHLTPTSHPHNASDY